MVQDREFHTMGATEVLQRSENIYFVLSLAQLGWQTDMTVKHCVEYCKPGSGLKLILQEMGNQCNK